MAERLEPGADAQLWPSSVLVRRYAHSGPPYLVFDRAEQTRLLLRRFTTLVEDSDDLLAAVVGAGQPEHDVIDCPFALDVHGGAHLHSCRRLAVEGGCEAGRAEKAWGPGRSSEQTPS